MTPLVDSGFAGGKRKCFVVDSGIRLNGMRQRINTAGSRDRRWTTNGQLRIDDGKSRPQMVTKDGKLGTLVRIVQHPGRRDFRSGP